MLSKKAKNERSARAVLAKMASGQWKCRGCSEIHDGLPDLAPDYPDVWEGNMTLAPNKDLTLDGDFLSDDFCVMGGEHFLVRGVLLLDVKGVEKGFSFGVWTSLSKKSFLTYLETFDEGLSEPGEPWPGWLCTHLGYFGETIGLRTAVVAQAARQRPRVYVVDHKEALGLAQENGLAASDLVDIFEYYGNHLPK